jgi:hypothetical protein
MKPVDSRQLIDTYSNKIAEIYTRRVRIAMQNMINSVEFLPIPNARQLVEEFSKLMKDYGYGESNYGFCRDEQFDNPHHGHDYNE